MNFVNTGDIVHNFKGCTYVLGNVPDEQEKIFDKYKCGGNPFEYDDTEVSICVPNC